MSTPKKLTKTITVGNPGYIVRSYSVKQAGQPIQENQVVRAGNGRFFGRDDPRSFSVLSSARCPTYGNCSYCWRSGPLNMQCLYCNDDGNIYTYFYINHPKGGKCILDAEYMAQLVGKGDDHVVALADRQYDWDRDHSQRLTYDMLMMRVPKSRKQEALHLTSDRDKYILLCYGRMNEGEKMQSQGGRGSMWGRIVYFCYCFTLM